MIKKIIEKNEEKIDKFVFYFSIIDILFFPYIWFISTNYALPIVAIWALLKIKEIIKMKEFKISVVLSVLMLISTIISFFYYPKELNSGIEIWVQNVKMMIQYASYFLYYILFVYVIRKYDVKVKKILLIFLGFAVVLGVIYMIDKSIFANIKTIWNNVDSYTIWYKEGKDIQYRYNFTWTDPNNPAYAFVALMVFLLLNEKTNIIEKIYVCTATFFLLICAMSTGASLSLGLVLIGIFIFDIIPNIKKIKKYINKKNIFICILISIAVTLLAITIFVCISKTDIYKESITRIFGNTDEGSSSRIAIWKRVLENSNIFRNFLVGTGGKQVILNDGTLLAPHNGNLYFIYAYGMSFYAIFMYEFFRKRKNCTLKNYLFVLPVFIGFTINTIVGEQKFIVLYLLLYVLSSFRKLNEEESEKIENIN